MTVHRKHHSSSLRKQASSVSEVYSDACWQSISLEPFTMPVKKRNTEKYAQALSSHHKFCQRWIGWQVLGDVGHRNNGPYIPAQEKKRQFQEASEAKKRQLERQWGLDEAITIKEAKKQKLMLRSGKVELAAVICTRRDTPRTLEKAAEVAGGSAVKVEEEDVVVNKKVLRNQMKAKEEKKKKKTVLNVTKKKKEILHRMQEEKKERRAAMLAAALPDELKAELEHDSGAEFETELTRPAAAVKPAPRLQLGAADSSQFVFSVVDPAAKQQQQQPEDLTVKKRKKRTIPELKEELRKQIERKKMLDRLREAGEGELAQEVVTSHGWEEAARKAEGNKVDMMQNLARDLKRAVNKQKNKGVKLKEVLKRQKLEAHKKLVKRQQNLREKRVQRLAGKMKRFSKKGHIVPGFM